MKWEKEIYGNSNILIASNNLTGNLASILVLSRKDIDLKPSFANILTCLVKTSFLGAGRKLGNCGWGGGGGGRSMQGLSSFKMNPQILQEKNEIPFHSCKFV